LLNRVVEILQAQRDDILEQWGQGVRTSSLSTSCQDVVMRLGELLYTDLISTVQSKGQPDTQRYREAVEGCSLSGAQDIFETIRLLRDLEDRIWKHLPSQLREADLPLVRHLAALNQAAFVSMVAVFSAMHEAWTTHLQALATTDSLTGCLSRGQLDLELRDEWERSNRYGRPFSLLMIDLDGMKAINDQLGHQAGDSLLREVAQYIRSKVRQVDLVGRYGGDEFLIIVPETASEGAAALARRLISGLVDLRPSLKLPAPITLSIGMVDSSQGFDGVSAMLEAVDRALYLAKSAGGDAYSDGKAVQRGAELRPAAVPQQARQLETSTEPAALSQQLREELTALRRQREELSRLIASLMEKLGPGRA
jgi:diguanylate cyclase (GGDEF)-like protein